MTKQPKVRKPHPVLHGIGLVPVSYTHLDVYKRQGDSFPEPFTVLLEYRGCPNHPRCGRTNRPKRNDAR